MPIPASVIASLVGGTAVLGGAGLSVASSNASTRKQYKYQSRLQEQAARLNYDYGIKSLENSPTAQRKGLESAGYNPMLAVQNATSGANAGWTSSGQVSAPDYAGSMSSSASAIQDIQRLANETKQTDSQVDLNEAQGRKVVADAIGQEIHNKYLPEREQKELGQIGAATEKLIRETSYMDQLAENMEAERRLQEMGLNIQSRANDINMYNAKTTRQHNNIVDAKTARYNEWAEKHPYLSSVSETLERHPRLHDYLLNYQKYKYDDNLRSKYDYDSESVIHYDKNGRERSSTKRTKHKRRY